MVTFDMMSEFQYLEASTVYSITGMASVGDTFYQYQDISIMGEGRKNDALETSPFETKL